MSAQDLRNSVRSRQTRRGRSGAPVLPVFLVREGESDCHRLEILPTVEMVDTGDRDADIRTNTQRCSEVIEAMVRAHPDQWVWFHERWRTRPEGGAAAVLTGRNGRAMAPYST